MSSPQAQARRTSQRGIVPAALGDVERDDSGSALSLSRISSCDRMDRCATHNDTISTIDLSRLRIDYLATPAKPKQNDGDPFVMLAFAGASGSSDAPPAAAPALDGGD